MSVYKVGHTLCRGSLLHIALLPAILFKLLLKSHNTEGIFILITRHLCTIIRMNFNNHTTVTPCCSTITWAHAIYNNLLFISSSWYNKTTRTHTETIYATSIYLGYKRVFCSRKIFSPTVFIMILYLIYEFTRMFKTHANCNAFSLNLYLRIIKIMIYVTSTMSCSKNYWAMEF